MEPFDLPTLDGLHLIEGLCNGLHLIEGLCDGVFFGAPTLAGFPSLKTLPHTAVLGFHVVNVHTTESRNKSMIVHIDNPHEGHAPEAVAHEMVGQPTFVGRPFLQQGRVAVSDTLLTY
ncbi:hypothetical protein B0H14DRAFT_2308879, partial [Mycena olivaceomarginata]